MVGTHLLSISRYADVVTARRTAKELALSIGFDGTAQEEIVLVVSELATNILKYASRGIVDLHVVYEAGRLGMHVSAHDRGGGFDAGQALQDGYSSANTLGFGLGAVKRLVDYMQIDSRQNRNAGTDIVCKKWLQKSLDSLAPSSRLPLDIGVISQAKPGQAVNGDAFVVKHEVNGDCLIAVIDGLGHGEYAHEAAQIAKVYIETYSQQALLELFRNVGVACQASRGLVMALAKFEHNCSYLSFASIGNIEAKIVGSQGKWSLPIKRGIVGRHAITPTFVKHPWLPTNQLVIHSDGISSHWDWQQFSPIHNKPAQFIAEHMHHKLYKAGDDATLVLVK